MTGHKRITFTIVHKLLQTSFIKLIRFVVLCRTTGQDTVKIKYKENCQEYSINYTKMRHDV